MLRVGFQDVKNVAIPHRFLSRLYQHFRVRDHPYGLQESLCTLALSLVRGLH